MVKIADDGEVPRRRRHGYGTERDERVIAHGRHKRDRYISTHPFPGRAGAFVCSLGFSRAPPRLHARFRTGSVARFGQLGQYRLLRPRENGTRFGFVVARRVGCGRVGFVGRHRGFALRLVGLLGGFCVGRNMAPFRNNLRDACPRSTGGEAPTRACRCRPLMLTRCSSCRTVRDNADSSHITSFSGAATEASRLALHQPSFPLASAARIFGRCSILRPSETR